MIDPDGIKAGAPHMIGAQSCNSGDGVVLDNADLIGGRPAFNSIAFQPVNPLIKLCYPGGNVAVLQISDHGGPGMAGGMMACLETLNAAGGAEAAVKILAFVALSPGRGRQPLALDRKERLIFRIFAAVDPDNRATWRYRKVD